MKFAAPRILWLLFIVLPPLIAFFWWSWRKRQELIKLFISERLLGHLKVGFSPSRQKARMAMIVAAVLFLILALARPQWGVLREEARQRGLDIIVAIDTSNSMLAEDAPPNRLARAKLAALDLMRRAKTDRLGLVAFAGEAFLECPLTLDDAAFSQSVNSLDTKTISQGGTAIAEAIAESLRAFSTETANHKVMVLFTDGEDQDSEVTAATEKAAKEGVIIFTIGIGTPDGEVLRIRDEHGRVDYIRNEQGQPVTSKLNEDLLQQIAHATKGFYLPLRGTKTMDTLYERGIAPLPKSENSAKFFQNYREQFYWPLLIAMALLIWEMFLPDRKKSKQSKTPAPLNATAPAITAALLFVMALPGTIWASPSSALQEYNEGKYQDALKDYIKQLDKKKDDPRLNFNAGAAAYQSKQLDEAARQFSTALQSPDLQLQQRAYYNLGNTLYRQGQLATEPDKKKEQWENALKEYQSALKLNKQDPDAKYNLDFVTKQIEELKKQQQQQQQSSDKDGQKNQDQKDQKQDQENQSKSDKKDQSQQDKDKDKKEQEKKDQAQKDQQKSEQQKQQDKKSEQAKKDKEQQEQNKEDQQRQSGQSAQEKAKEKADEEKREAAMMAAGQMTPHQAQQLLDSQKEEDKVFQPAAQQEYHAKPSIQELVTASASQIVFRAVSEY